MHFYHFHIGDYKSHTHHLSLMEDLAFRRLLDHYYLHELPIKQRDVARQIGMREYEQEVLTVLNEFFVSTESGYTHPRADAEIAKFRKFAEDGKRGAAKRWLKGGDSPPNATPIATNNHKPRTINHIDTPDGVDDLVWKDYVEFRKKRKAPITERVIDGLRSEAKIAKMSLNDVIKECVVRGWQSFKAEWVAGKQSPADIIRTTVPGSTERDPALVKLDQDREKTKPPSLEMLARMAALRKSA
jgi:uncharacterized protein YdaU (DUF1376 family)